MKLALPFLFLASVLFAQNVNNVPVIQVNDKIIRQQEFADRLNGLPQIGGYSADEVKENLICTLIAESILSFEASKNKLDKTDHVRTLSDQYSNEALYEQWMDSEVRNPVRVSNDELKNAYKRFRQERIVEYWTSPSIAEARKISESVSKGLDTKDQPQLKKIDYGQSLESVEELVYNLKEGGVSKPILVDNLYYVFKLVKSSPHPKYSQQTFPYWIPTIEKIIRDRKEDAVLDKKFAQLMADKDFSIKKDAYNFLLEQLYPVIYDKNELKYKQPEQIQTQLLAKEIRSENMFDRPLVIFKQGNQWTVKDFWQKLSVSPFPLNYKDPEDLKAGLVDLIRRTILFESVNGDARKKQYQNSDYVKNQSAMWNDNLLAKALMSSYEKNINVSESDLLQRYEQVKDKNLKPEMRRIIPLFVKDRKLADDLLQQIRSGADITDLAVKYSENKMGLSKTDPGVYIKKDYWGEVGKEAFNLKVGQNSNVIVTNDTGFAIIKLVAIQGAAPYKYEEVRSQIEEVMKSETLQQQLNGLLQKTAKNYKVKINRDAVKKVEYMGGNMGIKKTHFPLRNFVPTMPLFDHNAKWYKEIVSKN